MKPFVLISNKEQGMLNCEVRFDHYSKFLMTTNGNIPDATLVFDAKLYTGWKWLT